MSNNNNNQQVYIFSFFHGEKAYNSLANFKLVEIEAECLVYQLRL